jgi:hypothetical protein
MHILKPINKSANSLYVLSADVDMNPKQREIGFHISFGIIVAA